LFVVMMLDINFVRLREGFLHYLPVGGLIGLVLLIELVVILSSWALGPGASPSVQHPMPAGVSNTEALGDLFYTEYYYLFQAAGLILLVAIIGAITLTHRQRPNVRRQSISRQVHRTREESVELKKVQPGSGI
jgi:NADH-quinone oxidoreductase subunit J